MASESDPVLRRVPSLVSYCQRVLSAHADAIACLGDDVRYDVIKPVLECCSADTLLRLEQSSPSLEQDTSDLWERLCFKSYPLLAEQLVRDSDQQLESWRDQYFLLCEAEAYRLEEVASRLRNQRMEAAERKREREVKLTDKLPPAKRARTWGSSNQPKTLFQKTKSEATKLRRSLYTPRLSPHVPHGKVPHPSSASPFVVPSTKPVDAPMTTKTVLVGRPPASTPQTTPCTTLHIKTAGPVSKDPPSLVTFPTPTDPSLRPTELRPSKPPIHKKDRMASLFMPKHRALSQLPPQMGNNRIVPAR